MNEKEKRRLILKKTRGIINKYGLYSDAIIENKRIVYARISSNPRKRGGIDGKDIKFSNLSKEAKNYLYIFRDELKEFNVQIIFKETEKDAFIRIRNPLPEDSLESAKIYLPGFGNFRGFVDKETGKITRKENSDWPDGYDYLLVEKAYNGPPAYKAKLPEEE